MLDRALRNIGLDGHAIVDVIARIGRYGVRDRLGHSLLDVVLELLRHDGLGRGLAGGLPRTDRQRRARRIPTSNPTQSGATDSARFLLEQDPKVALSLLEQVNSWIVYPDTIELHQSQDGSSWQVVQRKALNRPVVADASSRDLVSFDVPAGLRTRWIRVVARGGKRLPAWHAGAGQPAWIFADEIVVK